MITLREQASNIINQKARCSEDILELSKIAFNMSKAYANARKIAGEMEAWYNLMRAKETNNSIKDWKSVSESDQIGKLKAEISYGKYREEKEKLIGMREVIKQIDAFRIAYYVNEKWIEQALMSGTE